MAEGGRVLDASGWDVRVGPWVVVVGCEDGSGRLSRVALHATARLSASRVKMDLNTAMLTATLLGNHSRVTPTQLFSVGL